MNAIIYQLKTQSTEGSDTEQYYGTWILANTLKISTNILSTQNKTCWDMDSNSHKICTTRQKRYLMFALRAGFYKTIYALHQALMLYASVFQPFKVAEHPTMILLENPSYLESNFIFSIAYCGFPIFREAWLAIIISK